MRYKRILAEIAAEWLAWTRSEIDDAELIDRLDTVMRRRGIECFAALDAKFKALERALARTEPKS